MKQELILKSLADIPASALAVAASMPGRAVNASQQALGPALRATQREIRAARMNSEAFAGGVSARTSARFQSITPWLRGGLNE